MSDASTPMLEGALTDEPAHRDLSVYRPCSRLCMESQLPLSPSPALEGLVRTPNTGNHRIKFNDVLRTSRLGYVVYYLP